MEINPVKLVDAYLHQNDWRVKENSNVMYSYGGLVKYVAGRIMAEKWLSIYPEEISHAHDDGDIHSHDLGNFTSYCNGIDLELILSQGINGIKTHVASNPPKHFASAMDMAVTMMMNLQSEFAGAQAYSRFDTLLAPYIKQDRLDGIIRDYRDVKQEMQMFIYKLNYPTRGGSESPFTNLTFDVELLDEFKGKYPVINGKQCEFTYDECQEEMDMLNQSFMEIMIEGDAEGKGFQYPIPTYNITKDFDWESERHNKIFEMAGSLGIPYFQNLVNSDLDPSQIRAMCCRLSLDLNELKQMGGGLFGAESKTGSIGVITINLPRIGYLSDTKDELFQRLGKLMDIARDSLEIRRKTINYWAFEHEPSLYPYTQEYVRSFRTFFSTIGLVGANEMCVNFLGETIGTKAGKELTLEVLDFMRERLVKYQEQTGHLYNLEQTPAESTAGRLAMKDKAKYPKIFTMKNPDPYYTNSCHLPVNYTDDIFKTLEHQSDLVEKFTGGSVVHLFLKESIDDINVVKQLVKNVCENYTLPYFTLTPTYSICDEHGFLRGKQEICPKCNEEITELEEKLNKIQQGES